MKWSHDATSAPAALLTDDQRRAQEDAHGRAHRKKHKSSSAGARSRRAPAKKHMTFKNRVRALLGKPPLPDAPPKRTRLFTQMLLSFIVLTLVTSFVAGALNVTLVRNYVQDSSMGDAAGPRGGDSRYGRAPRRQPESHKRTAARRVGAPDQRPGDTDKHRHDAGDAPDAAQSPPHRHNGHGHDPDPGRGRRGRGSGRRRRRGLRRRVGCGQYPDTQRDRLRAGLQHTLRSDRCRRAAVRLHGGHMAVRRRTDNIGRTGRRRRAAVPAAVADRRRVAQYIADNEFGGVDIDAVCNNAVAAADPAHRAARGCDDPHRTAHGQRHTTASASRYLPLPKSLSSASRSITFRATCTPPFARSIRRR